MTKKFALVLLISFLLAACSGQSSESTPAPLTPTPVDASPSGIQIVPVASEIVLGPNRFAVGLIDPSKGMIQDASVHFIYFDLSDP